MSVLVGMAVIAAASAIAQFVNSERGRAASRRERESLQRTLEAIQQPDFDLEQLRPEDYAVVQQYVPEIAPYVAEAAPRLVETTQHMMQGRGAQMDALSQLRSTARQSTDPAFQARLEEASRQSQADAQSRQNSILMRQQRMGQGQGAGGMASIAAQLQGAGDSMERGAAAGRQGAIESYRNQQAAIRDSANLGGNIYNQDMNLGKSNADIINSFNQRSAANQNRYNQYRANTGNIAQQQNIASAQRVADQNVGNRNKYKNMAHYDIPQQNYNNELSKYGHRADNSRARQQEITDRTSDYNQGISGLGEAGMSGYKYDQSQDYNNRMADNSNKQVIFERTGQWKSPDEYEQWQLEQQRRQSGG